MHVGVTFFVSMYPRIAIYSKCPDALGRLRVELLYLIVVVASKLVISNSTKAI